MATSERFVEVFARVERIIEDRWQIPVRIRDVYRRWLAWFEEHLR